MEPQEQAPSSEDVAVVASANGTAVAAARHHTPKRKIGGVKTAEARGTEGDSATCRVPTRISPSTRLAAARWIDDDGSFSSEAVARAQTPPR
jgi:hypothetical protein